MRFLVGGAVVLAMAGPAGAQQVDQSALGAMGPSVTSAQAELVVWCNLIKDGSARAAWDRASPRLKSIYTVENWQQAWSGVVGTLQPITNRKITAVRYVPADADRNPEAVVFDTRVEFQGGTFGGETVVVALEAGAGPGTATTAAWSAVPPRLRPSARGGPGTRASGASQSSRRARCRIASRTREGVNGRVRSRTPTASWIAFAIAGMAGCRGPSPASFAPYGPPGSMDSTTNASMSGVSRLVMIR